MQGAFCDIIRGLPAHSNPKARDEYAPTQIFTACGGCAGGSGPAGGRGAGRTGGGSAGYTLHRRPGGGAGNCLDALPDRQKAAGERGRRQHDARQKRQRHADAVWHAAGQDRACRQHRAAHRAGLRDTVRCQAVLRRGACRGVLGSLHGAGQREPRQGRRAAAGRPDRLRQRQAGTQQRGPDRGHSGGGRRTPERGVPAQRCPAHGDADPDGGRKRSIQGGRLGAGLGRRHRHHELCGPAARHIRGAGAFYQ